MHNVTIPLPARCVIGQVDVVRRQIVLVRVQLERLCVPLFGVSHVDDHEAIETLVAEGSILPEEASGNPVDVVVSD